MILKPKREQSETPLRTVELSVTDPAAWMVRDDIRRAAHWFYWIGGLSLVNTILVLTKAGLGFAVELGFTMVLDSLARELGGMWLLLSLPIYLLLLTFFGAMGFFAGRGAKWAFLLGMLVYALDLLLVLFFRQWFMVAFHGIALFHLGSGLLMCFRDDQANRE